MSDKELIGGYLDPTTNRFGKGNKGRVAVKDGGKPNRMSVIKRQIEDNMKDVVTRTIEAAMAGDMQAARILFNKTMPDLKSIDVKTDGAELPTFLVNRTTTIIESEPTHDEENENEET